MFFQITGIPLTFDHLKRHIPCVTWLSSTQKSYHRRFFGEHCLATSLFCSRVRITCFVLKKTSKMDIISESLGNQRCIGNQTFHFIYIILLDDFPLRRAEKFSIHAAQSPLLGSQTCGTIGVCFTVFHQEVDNSSWKTHVLRRNLPPQNYLWLFQTEKFAIKNFGSKCGKATGLRHKQPWRGLQLMESTTWRIIPGLGYVVRITPIYKP